MVTKGLFQLFRLFGPEVFFEFKCPLCDQSQHVLLSDPSFHLLVVKKDSVHHSLSDRDPYHLLFSFLTRASAACLAAAERCAGVRRRAVALPPLRPIAWKYSNVILVIRNRDGAHPVHSATPTLLLNSDTGARSRSRA
jgi:hypothetical protein